MIKEKIILFDGVCNLCNGIVSFVIKSDKTKNIKFASLQSENGKMLLKKFKLPTTTFDSFVFIIGDKYFLKSTAGLHVLRELGGVWKLFYIFMIIPRPMRDTIYNRTAKTRYRIFGKRNKCMIPTDNIKERFLL